MERCAILPFRSRTNAQNWSKNGTIRVLPLAHASMLSLWEARRDNNTAKKMEDFKNTIGLLGVSLASLTSLLKLNMTIISFTKLVYRRRRNRCFNWCLRQFVRTCYVFSPSSSYFGLGWTGSLSPPREAAVSLRNSI